MKQLSSDRLKLDYKRSQAARYFAERFSREQRYLIIFARDFSGYIKSADCLMKKDIENQFYFDFLVSFDSLNEKIREFSWSSDFLKENGIDMEEINSLYNAVA